MKILWKTKGNIAFISYSKSLVEFPACISQLALNQAVPLVDKLLSIFSTERQHLWRFLLWNKHYLKLFLYLLPCVHNKSQRIRNCYLTDQEIYHDLLNLLTCLNVGAEYCHRESPEHMWYASRSLIWQWEKIWKAGTLQRAACDSPLECTGLWDRRKATWTC